ncbi:MAG: hypothetical protein HY063_06425 [Bacteroidetes bacterium]|nr:hypothetical protein [Bacteroidota bacterium]
MAKNDNGCGTVQRKPTKMFSELRQVISTYDLWDEWIDSNDCFLRQREKDALLLFLQLRSVTAVARQLRVSIGHISSVLNHTKHRLRWNYKLYRQWIGDKMLEQAGAYDHLSPTDRFLCRPLHYHKMHRLLYYSLRDCGDTLADILEKHSARDLLHRRNFGDKKLFYFRQFLKKNNCLHLLKSNFAPTDNKVK